MAKKKQRRLKKVQVDSIALVDNPAVQDAMYVIAKRDDGDDENADVRKRADAFLGAIAEIRNVASELDEDGLCVLADLIWYTKNKYHDDDSVQDELMKFTEDIQKSGVELPGKDKEDTTDDNVSKQDEVAAAVGSGEGSGGDDSLQDLIKDVASRLEALESVVQKATDDSDTTEPVNGNGKPKLDDRLEKAGDVIADEREAASVQLVEKAFDEFRGLAEDMKALASEAGSVRGELNHALGKIEE